VVPGITQAIAGSRARKVYVANLRPEVPETEGFTLQDHVEALLRHAIVPDQVLVDEHSVFATQPCSLPTTYADLAGENGLVHDVQKLVRTLSALCAE
jgi:2-phospho-L-lactate transferase/gluconeogenesis factor (CofD/UPF0052 family)